MKNKEFSDKFKEIDNKLLLISISNTESEKIDNISTRVDVIEKKFSHYENFMQNF